MFTISQNHQLLPLDDGNTVTRLAMREMFDRVMNVAQLLHQHEQTLHSRVETAGEDTEKTQDSDAVVL